MKPMTKEEILTKIKTIRKGSWVNIIKSKDLGQGIVKYTRMTVRLGVIYSHIKRVGKVATSGNGKLPWGEWLVDNLVITHKGELYLRVANAYTRNTKSWYELNGTSVDKSMVVSMVGEEKSSESAVYNIKFRNIIALGK